MVANVMRVAAILMLSLAWMGELRAETDDPTAPPSATAASQATGGGGTAKGEVAAAVLESVLIPAKGRPLAIISGKRVLLGEKFGEDKLVKVTENEVVLRGQGGETRLPLNPAVSLKPTVHRASAVQSRRRSQP